MSPYLALRGVARRLSTAATSEAAVELVTISQTKNRLRNAYDPDEALKIYSSFTAANDPTTSPASTRFVQELTVRRLAKSHRFSDIKNFLESHKSQPQISQEPFLSSLIRSYGVVGMFENAVNTYNEMTDLGTPRTPLSFNALLSACIDSKVFDRVPLYFYEFPSKFGFQPDKFSYGILIKAYCEMGQPETATEKLVEMEEKGLETGVITFTTILHALYKKGSVDEAMKFWDEMVTKKGMSPDVACYNVRLFHVHNGKPEDVKGLIDEMIDDGIKPDTISYNYLITCYCVNGMMDEAMKVYNDDILKAKGRNPNAATFRTVVFHLCKKGRFVTGYKVFKKSVEARKIPDFNTLKYLLEGLAKGEGHMDEVKAMIRTMNKKFPPELLKAWGKIVDELGLADVEVNTGEGEKEDNSPEMEKASA
ncbi:pentatricopeptide repeat-containing protein at4g36680 mitochondrial [Phtheirospermum japonicum]|uniref:Pentatricopeptide repeat-containing protein at4g36680 mitochondrial n=1 Tax=Phtheirospermum japonicum TaxID=374723 RepID=A0A830BH56_9LAMI|nr:pentatricopeptide repeat-containing protein at4g36680 mitochondrial [Phtheirospermum japonicum]